MTTTTAPAPQRGTGSALTLSLGVASVVALAVTVGMGLTLPPTTEQAEYSRLVAIHPGLAWASYLAFLVTAGASALWLWPRTRSLTLDLAAGASAEIGVLFTALTLATGSIWGKPTWGTWWEWDARLTLSALMLAIYLGYLALRRVPSDPETRGRRSAITALLAVLVVPINHFAVEWWNTLHQGRTLMQAEPRSSADPAFIAAMVVGTLAMTLVYAWFLVHRVRIARLEEAVADTSLAEALAERRAEGVAG